MTRSQRLFLLLSRTFLYLRFIKVITRLPFFLLGHKSVWVAKHSDGFLLWAINIDWDNRVMHIVFVASLRCFLFYFFCRIKPFGNFFDVAAASKMFESFFDRIIIFWRAWTFFYYSLLPFWIARSQAFVLWLLLPLLYLYRLLCRIRIHPIAIDWVFHSFLK